MHPVSSAAELAATVQGSVRVCVSSATFLAITLSRTPRRADASGGPKAVLLAMHDSHARRSQTSLNLRGAFGVQAL